ncbi:hypothetical protein TcG_11635 [Trypanosoma cruzi]|nr:hypothetical protein TcG_11635 [Trypanosoma cruzi]
MQIALFSVVWGITVMHRCCGVYDLWSCVWPLAQRILAVCAVTAVPQGCGDRGERNPWTNPPCAPRCCCFSPTLFWVDDIHSPSLRRSSCMYCASNTVPSHCVGESLVVASIHDCAYCRSCSSLVFLVAIV